MERKYFLSDKKVNLKIDPIFNLKTLYNQKIHYTICIVSSQLSKS